MLLDSAASWSSRHASATRQQPTLQLQGKEIRPRCSGLLNTINDEESILTKKKLKRISNLNIASYCASAENIDSKLWYLCRIHYLLTAVICMLYA